MFFAIVAAMPTTPVPSSSAAAHSWPPIAATASAGERQHERDDLPADRVRQERERVDVGAVDRRERRRAPDAGVDARAPERAHERQRAVDAAAPQHAAVEELLRDGAPSASVSPSP